MMNTLPIFAVTGRAIWFVIANLFTLFRLTWLPLAALIAASYAIAYGVVQVSPGATKDTILEGTPFLFAAVTQLILQGLVLSVVAVHVHRIILFGDRKPGTYFAFPFGRTELLYVLMGTLTYVVLILMISVAAYFYYTLRMLEPQGVSLIIAAVVQPSAAPDAPQSSGIVNISIMVATAIIALWAMLRLTVWPPAVVANNRLSLGEALRLTRGRVFALLGLMIASSLVFSLVFFIAGAVVGYGAYNAQSADMSAIETMSLNGKILHLLKGAPVNPDAMILEFVYTLFVTAYTVAILSYAYKALKGLDADIPIDQQGAEPADDPILHMKPLGAL